MEILLGATAIGTDGKLGEVARFFIDPESGRAEQMTIKPGLGEEHIVSLMRVTRVDGTKVYLDADRQAVNDAPRFSAHAYRVPHEDDETTLTPKTDVGDTASIQAQPGNISTAEGWNVQVDRSGTLPEFTPEDELEPMVARDTPVLDSNGSKVAGVKEFGVDNVTGLPTRLTVHAAGLFGHNTDIALDQVQEYGPEGILLKLSGDNLKKG